MHPKKLHISLEIACNALFNILQMSSFLVQPMDFSNDFFNIFLEFVLKK